MAVGTVTKYNGFEKTIEDYALRQWNDPTAGNLMWVLGTAAYTPSAAHATVSDLGGAYITSGNGAPQNVTTPVLDNTTTAGSTYYSADDANFGSSVTITAKYLICVQPVTAGTIASTSKLLFYVDLNTASGSATVSSTAASFIVYKPTNGWLKST